MWLELLAVLALSGLAVAVSAPNTTSAGLVPITFGPSNLPGFEMGSTNRSSIIVVQEYWGVTDSVKAQAELLARQGFRVLIPELYKQQLTPAGTIPELAVPAGAPPQQQQQLAAASTSRKREAPAANKSRAAKQGASNNGVAKRASVARLA
ncbi:hypothetical protein V8C86DRAFT_3092615 [Haematococcus lacustris]